MKEYEQFIPTFSQSSAKDERDPDAARKIKILLLEDISETALEEFEKCGRAVEIKKLPNALGEAELIEEIQGVHVLGIRSKTRVGENVLAAADCLRAIGCYCVGTNQIDLRVAERKNIAVFNAPYANTRSVAELVIGLCIVLMRRVAEKNCAAHRGVWLKESCGSYELRGKTLGIVGYGNIGSQVSEMVEALGMNVVYYDIEEKLPRGNARPTGALRELLTQSHIVTLHVPSNASTRNMINAETLSYLRKNSIFINYSRGDVVDLDALRAAIENGTIGGAGVDVYPFEPERNGDRFACVLQNLPNVILTPHIGGSTEEAQANIGRDVTRKLIEHLETARSIDASFDAPTIELSEILSAPNRQPIQEIGAGSSFVA